MSFRKSKDQPLSFTLVLQTCNLIFSQFQQNNFVAEFATALCVRRTNANVAFRQPVNPYKCITKEYMLATLLGAKNRMQGFCTARFCPLNKPSCFLK